MSQFILFTRHSSNIGKKFEVEVISRLKSHSLFLQNFSKFYFVTIDFDNIYTIPNFDDLCMLTQKQLINSIAIKETKLWNILYELRKEEIFLWYGGEMEDLDEVHNYGLFNSSLKFYF